MLLEYEKNVSSNLVITWKFNPPSAPNFGGLWEAGVKAVKLQLIRITEDEALTYEKQYTLLVQIEAILNSRLLTPANNYPNDLAALTPGHFLVLEPLSTLPINLSVSDIFGKGTPENISTQQRTKWY